MLEFFPGFGVAPVLGEEGAFISTTICLLFLLRAPFGFLFVMIISGVFSSAPQTNFRLRS
ncbi:MAG: hypothetical protein DMG58_23525 [Acidobacteria bacterium]|nr:MAG: hypothetical protein DMG58_23525 [Acidobacteriota bacterium]